MTNQMPLVVMVVGQWRQSITEQAATGPHMHPYDVFIALNSNSKQLFWIVIHNHENIIQVHMQSSRHSLNKNRIIYKTKLHNAGH